MPYASAATLFGRSEHGKAPRRIVAPLFRRLLCSGIRSMTG